MRRYSSPKYTVFNFMPNSSATSFTWWPQPLQQSNSQNGVFIATASISTPCSSIILTARLLSRPPDSKATAFGFFSSTDLSTFCCDIVSLCGHLVIKMICAPPLTHTLSRVPHTLFSVRAIQRVYYEYCVILCVFYCVLGVYVICCSASFSLNILERKWATCV